MAAVFTKYPYEEIYRYYQFKRTDGKDGLAPEETISSPEVTCEDKDGVDCSSDMISNVSVYEDTQVTYKLKGGTAGATYNIIVKTVTTNNQKLQGKVEIAIS